MHTLMKDGLLSSTQDILLDYIVYSLKISELAKRYPFAKVMQYDDLYRRMQFAISCKWGADSQFISNQTLHRPDFLTPAPTRPLIRKASRLVINQATRKQVCFGYQRREGCRFGSSCRYDHVCIKLQWWDPTRNGNTSPLLLQTPNFKATLNCRDLPELYFDCRASRRYLDRIAFCKDWSRLNDTPYRRLWGKLIYQSRALSGICAAAPSN